MKSFLKRFDLYVNNFTWWALVLLFLLFAFSYGDPISLSLFWLRLVRVGIIVSVFLLLVTLPFSKTRDGVGSGKKGWLSPKRKTLMRQVSIWTFALFGLAFMGYVQLYFFSIGKVLLAALGIVLVIDFLLLVIFKKPVSGTRVMGEKWSLGDQNKVHIHLKNNTYLIWKVKVLEEFPDQLQIRRFALRAKLDERKSKELTYEVKPLSRGQYVYGSLRLFIRSPLGLLSRRISEEAGQKVAVYPSILQMKKYALVTVSSISKLYGVKKIRRIGHSYEFEQIKDYVRGDDMRHINWKATSRSGAIKTNHYTDEKSQPVYCIIDKSRVMNMAFDGLTLLDYAINASLVIANTTLQKGDRAGLITFSDKVGTAIRADNSPGTLRRLLDSLYIQKYRAAESDYEFLFKAIQRVANTRSLIFLFCNFESIYAMQRVLPVLRKINNTHLLVTIFFENAEVEEYAYSPSHSLQEIYSRSVARQMVSDKRQIAYELQNHGIQSIITRPQDLTINTLNKYLELKAKGQI